VNARIIGSNVPLGAYPDRVLDDLVRWAREAPHRPFIFERSGDHGEGDWVALTFGSALSRARAIGAALLADGFSADRPLAILAENSIDHAVVALAAMYVGVPLSPLSTGYARPDGDPGRLQALFEVLQPHAVYAPDERLAARIAHSVPTVRLLRDLAKRTGDGERADAAFAQITPDTVAKVLFTSGSTGTPKGVITTNRMMCANQTMLAQAWADITNDPVLVDWMPWSHVASGNKVFGMILRRGGVLYIDAGRPMPGAFDRTLLNLRGISPTMHFNVPRGYALLADALEADAALARTFFARLKGMVNAGASLPADVRAKIERCATRVAGKEIPILSPYGATETAPLATAVWGHPLPDLNSIGLPVPGAQIKLAPVDDRYELRVKGPSVTPGYWRNPVATASAFDEDGFYKTGDAGELVDANAPERGLAFRGRIAENFKLTSSTWVNAGAVRIALIEAANGAIDDAVITGHDRDDIGALIFFNLARSREITSRAGADRATLCAHPALRAFFADVLQAHNAVHRSNSTRIAGALLLADEPDRNAGELTDKGTVNARIALRRRAEAVRALYADPGTSDIIRPARAAVSTAS
jgi:feruloyl-CoA synthase